MNELPNKESLDEMSLRDLDVLVAELDPANPSTTHILRKWLMKNKENRLSLEEIGLLKQDIIVLSPETISSLVKTENRSRYKFVRENGRIIVFPESKRKGYLHIDYAVADGMKNPDDGGFLNFTSNTIIVEGISSSLHIHPRENAARPETMNIFREAASESEIVVNSR